MSAFIQMNAIAKRWNGQLGVEDINISVPEGSFVALLGPSGCGKSTTLRLLAGLEMPDEGKIIINGEDLTGAPAHTRNISMVFQSYALFPHLSVEENVSFGMKVRKVPAAERKEKLNYALQVTGLLGCEKRKPSELSGGQRQRVALARAIVAGQKLCLMDEPLSNLDAKLRHSVRKDIKSLQKKLGITIVYVTHDQNEAMSMADMIVLMKDGRIIQTGTPEELYYKPSNSFTAEFVGTPPMGLIQGAALDGVADEHLVGIRAEYLHEATEDNVMLRCEVSDIEFLGAETLIGLEHPSATGLMFKCEGKTDYQIGSHVNVMFLRKDTCTFDSEGNSIQDSLPT